MNDDKKDALLQQIEALIADPIPLLNLPESDRLEWEDRLFTLAELLEDFRSGVLAKDLPNGFSRYSSQDYLKTPEDVRAYAEATAEPAPRPIPTSERLDRVDGDCLPEIGSKVMIHLASIDSWIEHEVVGYYAWGDLRGDKNLHRVFVRVKDSDGILNSRLLKDVIIPPQTTTAYSDNETGLQRPESPK